MDGRTTLLVLAHLFQKRGSPLAIEQAVECLSFEWRYGPPSMVRRLLTAAMQNGLISRQGEKIRAEFVFDKQALSVQAACKLLDSIVIDTKYDAMH